MARTIEASLRREREYTQARVIKQGQAWVRSEDKKRGEKQRGKERREWSKVRG